MKPRLGAFGLSLAVFALDRFSKLWIENNLSAFDTRVVIPGFFHIVYTQNRGAAFGLFSDSGGFWRDALLIGLAVIILAVVGRMLWRAETPFRNRLGLALVFGGALGNLHDRIVFGGVTDFLEFSLGAFRWPAFNVADSAITAGAALLALELWKPRQLRPECTRS